MKTRLETDIILANTLWVWTLVLVGMADVVMMCGGGTVAEFSAGLVERTFWRSSLRWPLAVAMNLGRCLNTWSEVRPGQVIK